MTYIITFYEQNGDTVGQPHLLTYPDTQRAFSESFDLQNNKTYTYTIDAVNGQAIARTTGKYYFCYPVPPETLSVKSVTVISQTSSISLTFDLPDMGFPCTTQKNSISVDTNSQCSGEIKGEKVFLTCTVDPAFQSLTVKYTLSNGNNHTDGSLKIDNFALIYPNLQVFTQRFGTLSSQFVENKYFYYVSPDEIRSSFLHFDEPENMASLPQDLDITYTISLEESSATTKNSVLLRDVKPGTKILPLLLPGRVYRAKCGFFDAATQSDYFPKDFITIQTVADVLGPMITVPEFGTSIQNTFSVKFDFSLSHTSFIVKLSCFGNNEVIDKVAGNNNLFTVTPSQTCQSGYGLSVEVTTSEGVVFESESQQLVFFAQNNGGCDSSNVPLAAMAPSDNAITVFRLFTLNGRMRLIFALPRLIPIDFTSRATTALLSSSPW